MIIKINIVLFFVVIFCFSSVKADIYKCQDSEGRTHYFRDSKEIGIYCPENSTKKIYRTPSKAEIKKMVQQEKERARREYWDHVRSTAKFLDDVESMRKK
jgi:hypothetical protein